MTVDTIIADLKNCQGGVHRIRHTREHGKTMARIIASSGKSLSEAFEGNEELLHDPIAEMLSTELNTHQNSRLDPRRFTGTIYRD